LWEPNDIDNTEIARYVAWLQADGHPHPVLAEPTMPGATWLTSTNETHARQRQ